MAHCPEGHAMEYSSMACQGCEVQMQSIYIFYVVGAASLMHFKLQPAPVVR